MIRSKGEVAHGQASASLAAPSGGLEEYLADCACILNLKDGKGSRNSIIMLFVQHLCVVIFTCMRDVISTLKCSTCVLSQNINISKFKGQTSALLFARY